MDADDTTLQHFGSNLKEMEEEVDEWVHKLSQYFIINKLTLNIKNTKLILFSPQSTKNDFNLTINGNKVQQVGTGRSEKTVRFLGLDLDENLNWKQHILQLGRDVRKIAFSLIFAIRSVPTKLRFLLYNALIKSEFEYGLEYFGGSSTMHELVLIQKKWSGG